MTRLPAVIGIGNEHRGDDAAGLLAVRALRELLPGDRAAEILEHRGDGASLMDLWGGREWVILVDALQSDGRAGTVMRFDASDEPLGLEHRGTSTHSFGPAGAIEMSRCLGHLPPRVELYGIVGWVFLMGAEPQPAVCEAAHEVARAIATTLHKSGLDVSV